MNPNSEGSRRVREKTTFSRCTGRRLRRTAGGHNAALPPEDPGGDPSIPDRDDGTTEADQDRSI